MGGRYFPPRVLENTPPPCPVSTTTYEWEKPALAPSTSPSIRQITIAWCASWLCFLALCAKTMHSALHLHQLGRWSQVNCSSSVELGLRRRTAVGARAAGCGRRMLAILVMMMLASTDAFSLKRWGKSGLSALSKRGTGGREKVRCDVGCGMVGRCVMRYVYDSYTRCHIGLVVLQSIVVPSRAYTRCCEDSKPSASGNVSVLPSVRAAGEGGRCVAAGGPKRRGVEACERRWPCQGELRRCKQHANHGSTAVQAAVVLCAYRSESRGNTRPVANGNAISISRIPQ